MPGSHNPHQAPIFILPAASVRAERARRHAVVGQLLDRHGRRAGAHLPRAAHHPHHDDAGQWGAHAQCERS